MAYSLDMRERALELLKAGKKKSEIAVLFDVSRTTLLRWEQRLAQGELAASYPKKRSGFRVDDEKLKAYVAANPDAYQAEIGEAIGAKANSVCRALKRLKITLKKNSAIP
jgi:transposase